MGVDKCPWVVLGSLATLGSKLGPRVAALEPKTFQLDKLVGNANVFGRKPCLGMEPLVEC